MRERGADRRAGAGPAAPPLPPRPALPDDVTGSELDRPLLASLRTLVDWRAVEVARHLVVVGRLLDRDDAPAAEEAWSHAQAAVSLAGRVGSVREVAGLAAYRAGHFAAALREMRTARRLTGHHDQLPLMADCERGLGRPHKALEVVAATDSRLLDRAGRIEMLLVAAGARRDLGQLDAAIALLAGPASRASARHPEDARLLYGYADALLAAGRVNEAREYMHRAAAADVHGSTDADERLEALDGDGIVDALAAEADVDDDHGSDDHAVVVEPVRSLADDGL